MKGLWRIGLVIVLVLLPACSERQKMIRLAKQNMPPTATAAGR